MNLVSENKPRFNNLGTSLVTVRLDLLITADVAHTQAVHGSNFFLHANPRLLRIKWQSALVINNRGGFDDPHLSVTKRHHYPLIGVAVLSGCFSFQLRSKQTYTIVLTRAQVVFLMRDYRLQHTCSEACWVHPMPQALPPSPLARYNPQHPPDPSPRHHRGGILEENLPEG